MKKVLSIVLVLMMVLGAVACTQTPAPAAANTATEAPKATDAPKVDPTEAPAEPAEPAADATEYVALGLNIKNKTGKTIDAFYIYPEGAEDMGNSVVHKNWLCQDESKEDYEKDILIIRPAGAPLEATVVYADGEKETWEAWQMGDVVMYNKLTLKDGTTPDTWENKATKDADHATIDAVVAIGKTADNFYPGYQPIKAEVKNKTDNDIVEFYLYEKGGDPKAYNNFVDTITDAEGNPLGFWKSGKQKEGNGAKYVFSYFLRPEGIEDINVNVVLADGTGFDSKDTQASEGLDWFDGEPQKNEISMKSADGTDLKIEWDDGTDDDYNLPLDERLAFEVQYGLTADLWFPTYPGAEACIAAADPELVAAAKAAYYEEYKKALAEQYGIVLDASEEPAETTETAEVAEAAAVPEGYTGISLLIKNKTGKEISKVYLYPAGEDKGKNVFKTLLESLPTEDESITDSKPHEVYCYVFRETDKLGAMELIVRYPDDSTETYTLTDPVTAFTTFTLKEGEYKQKETDDAEDLAAMAALAAAGLPTDDVMPEVADAEPTVEPVAEATTEATEPAAEAIEYVALGLKFKNKFGKAFKEAYIYPVGEDKGANVLTENLPTEGEGPEDSEEIVLFIYRDAAKLEKMAVTVITVDGEEIYWEAPSALGNNYKITVKSDITDWSYEEITKEKDLTKIAEFVALGVTSDGFDPTK